MRRDFVALVQGVMGDRFKIERELGRGGAARVFLAREPGGRQVALKVLHPELLASSAADRFLREIRLAGKLAHPNIAPLLESGEAGWAVFYTMAYVEGPSLRERLTTGPLGVQETRRVATDLLSALQHAHEQGIVHRDVKPENIVLSPVGAVLLDFGIARAVETIGAEHLTRSGITLGTSAYMSPEQVQGLRNLGPPTDLYSLACVLFECLAGRPPFVHPNEFMVLRQHLSDPPPGLAALVPATPPGLADALGRALAKAPEDRWQSAGEMRNAVLL
ncbi:MAG TPA: serine/threonine-protein kinase [Gemmatimonadales bacterium]|nr:serine/threonine-protein kinase [Gemmatimonadales bacterium]